MYIYNIHTYIHIYIYIYKGTPSRGCGGCNPLPPTHTHTRTYTFFKSVGILTKLVAKISWPSVVGKFGVFHHKKTKCRILSISSHAEIKTFTGDDGFYRSYIRFVPTIMIIMNILPWDTLDFLPTTSYDVCQWHLSMRRKDDMKMKL